MVCERVSISFDPCIDISLEMPQNKSNSSSLPRYLKRQIAKQQKKKRNKGGKKNKKYKYDFEEEEEPLPPEPAQPDEPAEEKKE